MKLKNATIKLVEPADARAVWRIRNGKTARSNSVNTKKIVFKDHKTRFEHKYFKNKKNFCFVLKLFGRVVGYCRFDSVKGKLLVAIALAEKWQGRGLGNYILENCLKLIKTRKDILAEIKLANESSLKIFLKNKFEIYKQNDKLFYLKYNKPQDNFRKKIIELYYRLIRENLKKSRLIVWPQGDRYDRAEKVLSLYREGWAPKIIVTGNNKLIGKHKRSGENNVTIENMASWLVKRQVKKQNIISDTTSLNTKEQAEFVIKLVKKKKWKSLILTGSSYYQPRVFLTFLRQAEKANWPGKIINAPAEIPLNTAPSGRKKYAWQYLNEEASKIKKYKKDLVAPAQALKNLK